MSEQAAARATAGVLWAALFTVAPLAASACTTSYVECDCLQTPEPSAEPARSCAGPWQDGLPCEGACYDIPNGKLALRAEAPTCEALARIRDEFVLRGVDGGLRTFRARLHLVGTLAGSAMLEVDWDDGVLQETLYYSSLSSPLDLYLDHRLQRTPGEPFELLVSLRATALGQADVSALLEFTDLPAGAEVGSCNGYAVPVPARPLTWGRIRGLYR